MINLSEGVEERAMERAEKEKIEAVRETKESFVMNMYELGYTYDQISDVTKLDVDDVKIIIKSKVN